jgi:hypothetical protein
MKSALAKIAPKKTIHSTSSHIKEPESSISNHVTLDLGKRHMTSDTLIIKKMFNNSPIKAASYLMPSYVKRGFPVKKLNTINMEWIIGSRSLVR